MIRSSMVSFVMMCCTTTVADVWPCRHRRATVCWYSRVALIFVWYELHSVSPPIAFRIPPICSAASRTYTLKPSDSNCLLRRTCKGRKVLPGALTSTNASLPPGKRTMRSGTPSYPGDTNFGQMPPRCNTIRTSFCSIVFSLISLSPFSFSVMCKVYQGHFINSSIAFFLKFSLKRLFVYDLDTPCHSPDYFRKSSKSPSSVFSRNPAK